MRQALAPSTPLTTTTLPAPLRSRRAASPLIQRYHTPGLAGSSSLEVAGGQGTRHAEESEAETSPYGDDKALPRRPVARMFANEGRIARTDQLHRFVLFL